MSVAIITTCISHVICAAVIAVTHSRASTCWQHETFMYGHYYPIL